MVQNLCSHKLISLTTALLFPLVILFCFRFTPTASTQNIRLSQDLEHHFLQHQRLTLDTAAVAAQVHKTGRLSLATSDLSFDLQLAPHDMRAVGYRAEEFSADGVAHAIDIGPVRTFRGRAQATRNGEQLPQLGEARFTVDEKGIEGLIITPTDNYFVEPMRKYSNEASASDYVVYRQSDVQTSSTGECGVTLSEQVNRKAEAFRRSSGGELGATSVGAALQELRLATEADNEYVVSKGGPASASYAILSILNQVEGLFEIELGLSIRVVYQSAWSISNDPFSSTNPSELLGELSNHWNLNRGSVARDVVHMWTGKQLDNETIGIAYLEALCRYAGSGRAAYGLSKGVGGVQQIAITAHEIGHNLGATHPNQQVPPPLACENTVMSSSVMEGSLLSFCQYTRDEIAMYLTTSSTCLVEGTTQLTFGVAAIYSVGSGPTSIATGDFNGDSKQDLGIANINSNTLSVLLGRDDGSFSSVVNHGVGSRPRAVMTGDFNGDTKQDIVCANEDSHNVSLLLGTGTGNFQPAVYFALGLSPRALAKGDFNEDGKEDIAVTGFSSHHLAVLLGTGAGGFQDRVIYSVGNSAFEVVVSDFNNDGKQDLAVTTVGFNVSVLLGTGTGDFQQPIISAAGNSLLSIGDFNNDGHMDLVTHSLFITGMQIMLGNGNGSFQAPIEFPTGFSISSLVVLDFNGDGNDDVAVTNATGIGILFGTGNGGFNLVAEYSLGTALGRRAISAADFNGDDTDDLAIISFDTDLLSVLIGLGTGLFQGPAYYNPGLSPGSVSVCDLNNDGKPDLLMPGGNSGISVLLSTGSLHFQLPVIHSLGSFPSEAATGDFNEDGNLDVALANSNSGSVTVALGTGSGGLQSANDYFVGAGQYAVEVGDFNGDEKLDLALSLAGNSVAVLQGTGTGGFNPPNSFFLVGSTPSSLAIGDFNKDGKPDLVTANQQSNSISLLLGNGIGGFGAAVNFPVGLNPSSAAVGDFNGDGLHDIAVSNLFDSNVSVLLNNGNGTFGSAVNYGLPSSSLQVVAGDFNRDGKDDIATANFENRSVSLLLGTGNSGFLRRVDFSVGVIPGSLASGYFNEDEKLDLVLTDAGRASVNLLINTSGFSLNPPPNDYLSAGRVITGATGTIGGSTLLATAETGEPNHSASSNGSGGASIWYRWRAPSTGRFYFQTFSSSFPTVLAVYTGTSVAALTTVPDSSADPEYFEFDATAGTTYQIAIDGVTGDTGRTVLNWNTGSLLNDNFAFAREIRGTSGSVNGNNTKFTLETNEPSLPGPTGSALSAWYRWTAPNTGKVSFLAEPPASTPCGDTTRLLGAYTGNFLDILSLVAVNYDGYREFHDTGACDNRSLRFNAVAGTTYRIQLRSVIGKPFTLKWNYADPPANDNFTNALILAGNSGGVVGTNRDATKESGEPNHASGVGGASVWYRWTAPASGPVTFDTIGFRNQGSNSFRYLTALMAVYTGTSLNALTAVVTSSSPDNKVTFTATAGATYQIAVDSGPYVGGGYIPGIVPLHWGTKQISNDDFANAQALSAAGSFSPLLGSNVGATKEAGEPNHQGNVGGTSVWYRWTALTDGNASFVFNSCNTCTLSASNALISVYTGGSVNGLTPVPATADSNHTFSGVRGTTYFIAVDSNTGAGGTYEFSLVSSNISARNDTYANAQVLSGSAGAVAGDNSGATKEAAEPDHANDIGGASVWYQWKAPASGLYTFDTFGSNFDTLLGVYTGNVVSALSTVASSDNARTSSQSRVTFNAIVDTTYFIAVDGKSTGIDQGTGLSRSQTGFILLNWNNLPPPVNDNFGNAQVLSGLAGNVTGRNTVASKEGGEPNHAGSPGGVSVWYQWTAPGTGKVTFNTFGSDFNTLLGVYTGSAVNALTSVSSNDDVGDLAQSRVTFNAVAGTVYYIGVDGSVGVPGSVTPFTGNLVLSWFPELDGGNDSFAQAQTLSGSSGSVAGTNVGATKENGEPNHAGDRGGRSIWYSWTAPFNGPTLITTLGSDFDTLLAVYTGTTVSGLTPVGSNDDSPYMDNLGHTLSSSLTFTANAGITYKIVVDGSGGRFGNFALRWGPEAKISGQVSFLGGLCGSDKKVSMILSGEDARAVSFTGSDTYSFEHLRVGGNYSVRGVSGISANCLPLFLERAKSFFPLAGDVFEANFVDDGLRGGGSTSNITGHVTNAGGLGLYNVAVALSGAAARTVYTDSAGLYLLPNLPAGTYQVTPSKAGAVFSPARRDFTFTSGQTITDADFTTQDSYNISGQTRTGNGTALSGVRVTISNGVLPATVQTDENGYYSFDAVAGGNYTITASKAGLSFTPNERSVPALNTNTKNVDFAETAQTQTLTVASSNPGSGVNITVSPNDNNSQGSAATQFSRVYNSNTIVSLTAPATSGGNLFQKWLRNGLDFSTNQSTSVTMDADHTMTAVYITTVAQTPAGQNVTVQLNGVTVTFANVTGAGNTTIMPINPSAAGQLPNGYQLAGSGLAFDISTTAIVQPPITVCFSVPAVTDATAFSQLRILHNESGTLIDRTSSQDFATKMICATVNSLSPFVLATTTVPQLQLLLDASGPALSQVAALDSVLFLRDPFPVINGTNVSNFGPDRNTRLLIFVTHLQLAPGETAASVVVTLFDSNNQSFDIAAENVWSGPNNDFSQVTFRLPDTLATGTCTIEVKAHGQVSNLGTIRIRM